MSTSVCRAVVVTAALVLGCGHLALAAEKPAWTAAQMRTLNFRCTVVEGPKLTGCKALRAERVDPRIVEYSRDAVESLASCTLGPLKPGTEVTYPFPYADDPAYLENPIQPHVIKNPDYAEPPPFREIERLYPEQARRAGIAGKVVVKCGLGLNGRATNCEVVEEKPLGYGFGQAGLEALASFRFTPQLYDCKPTDKGVISVPIVFSSHR